MTEIPNSPLSRHDLNVLYRAIAQVRIQGRTPAEIILPSRRMKPVEGLRAFGLPVRVNDALGLNEGYILCDGSSPLEVDFEKAVA